MIKEVLSNRDYIVRLEEKGLVQGKYLNYIIKLEEFNKYDDYKINYEEEFLEEVKEKKKDNLDEKENKILHYITL